MQKNMLRDILEELVKVGDDVLRPIYDFLRKLNADKTGEFLKQFKLFLRGEMVEKIEQVICCLEPVSTFIVPATTKFLAIEKFVCDISSKAKVKINYIDNNFKEWFLSDDGKIEDPIGGDILRYFSLRKSSVDDFIMKELGGKAKAETTLSKMFSLMENKKNGELGILLDNGSANIFYIKDKNAVLRVVCVYWDSVGWMIKARSVGSPNECNGGDRVFSRHSD